MNLTAVYLAYAPTTIAPTATPTGGTGGGSGGTTGGGTDLTDLIHTRWMPLLLVITACAIIVIGFVKKNIGRALTVVAITLLALGINGLGASSSLTSQLSDSLAARIVHQVTG